MSRLGLSCLLVLSLASTASATGFAAPPPDAAAMRQAPIDTGLRADVPVGPSRIQVRDALIKMRAKNLAAFRAYYKGGVYPSNVYSKDLMNIWRDGEGHFCAAATIMVKSGSSALAIKIADENNFIKLANVEQGPVMDWILTSGFTQAELALIQRPFRPVISEPIVEPAAPILVDAKLRKAETARLLAKYKQIDKQLVAAQKRNLERAVDALMAKPDLAMQLVASS